MSYIGHGVCVTLYIIDYKSKYLTVKKLYSIKCISMICKNHFSVFLSLVISKLLFDNV